MKLALFYAVRSKKKTLQACCFPELAQKEKEHNKKMERKQQ
jgi:hypothetical protein